jgi:hypothetical protein
VKTPNCNRRKESVSSTAGDLRGTLDFSPSESLTEIERPDDIADIADLGPTLSETKRL